MEGGRTKIETLFPKPPIPPGTTLPHNTWKECQCHFSVIMPCYSSIESTVLDNMTCIQALSKTHRGMLTCIILLPSSLDDKLVVNGIY